MPKTVLAALCCLMHFTSVLGQPDTIFTSIQDHLEYYDVGNKTYVDYLPNSGVVTNAVSLKIRKNYLNDNWLVLHLEAGTSLFSQGAIIDKVNNDSILFINVSNFKIGQRLTFYLEGRNRGVDLQLASLTEDSAEDPVGPNIKHDQYFTNLIAVMILVVLGSFAYIKVTGSEVTAGHFKWIRAVSLRTINEALYKTRMFEKDNIQVIVAMSLLVASSIISIFYFSNHSTLAGSWFQFNNFTSGLLMWLLISAGIFLGFIVKNILINLSSLLYNFGSTTRIHFYNYLRLTSIIYVSFLILISISIFVLQNDNLYRFAHGLLMLLLAIRIILLMVKLLNSGSYRILHLFSYLCATELIPYMVLVKITFL